MKAKKVLAVALAAAMAFSALPGMSVKADEIVGGTVYIEQDIIDVILPTTESQKFYIDPQGLIALGKGEAVATGEGVVTGKSEMYAVNKSSMPLALSVSYKLKDSATTNGVTIATDASTAANVKDATGMAIAVYVRAEQSGVYEVASGSATATGAAAGFVYKADTNGLASGTGVDITDGIGMNNEDDIYASADGTKENYFMTAQSYKAKLKDGIATGDATKIYDSSSYEYVIDTTKTDASCVKLTIGGYCSTKANWSAYTKGDSGETLKLDVTFKFKKLTKVAGVEGAYYLDSAAGEVSAKTGYAKATEVSASQKSVTLELPANVKVSKVELVLNGTKTTLTNGNQYTASTTAINFAKYGSTWVGGSLVVTYSDNVSDTLTCK